jgi:hypothetical protein
MTKYLDPATHSKLLDLYSMYKMDTKVAALSGVSRVTLWRMSNISLEGTELQGVDWGGVIKPWHEHKLDALDMQVEDVQQRVTRDAAEGYYVDEVQGGIYHFIEDEYAMSLTDEEFNRQLALSDDDRDMLDYPKIWHDKYAREYNPRTRAWERLRVQRFIPPTLDAQAKVLAAFAPELFGDKRSITLQGSIGLGVTVVGTRPPIPPEYLAQAASPPLPPPPEALVYEDGDFEDILGPAPSEEETPMTEEPTPAAPAAPSTLTTEQQRILEQLRSPNPGVRAFAEKAQAALARSASGAAPATPAPALRPAGQPYSNGDQDDCAPRRPNGFKVA